jgi:hypothetical protein
MVGPLFRNGATFSMPEPTILRNLAIGKTVSGWFFGIFQRLVLIVVQNGCIVIKVPYISIHRETF